jgi:iron complex outermembrane recepter protein
VKRLAVLLFLGPLWAGAAAAAAQQPDLPRQVRSDTVIPLPALEATVTRGGLAPDRVPFAISVIESSALHLARPGVDLHEVLRRVPGVVVSNRHQLAMDTRISVRGFGARSAFGVRGVRVLLDGIPLTLPDGQATLTNVDPGSLGRIEVLRGPAAALYGNAAGGVVTLATREPGSARLLDATVAAGSHGTGELARLRRIQVNAGGGGSSDSWFVGLSHFSTDGFRDYSRGERSGLNARYRRALSSSTSVSAVLHVTAVPVAENPGALSLDSARSRPRMAWPGNVAMGSAKEASQLQAGAALTHRVGPTLLEAAGYGVGRSMDNPLPFGRYIRLHRSGGGARVLVRSVEDHPASWTVGVEAQAQSDDRVERDNLAGEMGGDTHQDRVDRVTSLAPFAFAQVEPHARLALRAGARYDAVAFESIDRLGVAADDRDARRVLDAWSGSAGALLDLGRQVRTWTSISTWFQTPTTTELINVPPAPGEPCCQTGFNPELEPQDGWGWEVGVAGRVGPARWEAVGFDMRVRNEILPFQVASVAGRDFYRNGGRSTHRGVEMAADLDLARGLTMGVVYAYSDFRFTQPDRPALTGNRLPGVPLHRLDGWITWRRGATSLELDVEWADRYPVDDANSHFAPSHALVDLRAARQARVGAGSIEPFVAVTNLFDARYSASVVINAFGGRYHEPGPGRSLLLGLRARFL